MFGQAAGLPTVPKTTPTFDPSAYAVAPKTKKQTMLEKLDVAEKELRGMLKPTAFDPSAYASEKGYTRYFQKGEQWYANKAGTWITAGSKAEAKGYTTEIEQVNIGTKDEPLTVSEGSTAQKDWEEKNKEKKEGTYDTNITKAQTDLDSAGTSKKDAFDNMIGVQTKLYEDEYSKVGMAGIKDKIAQTDSDIANRKASLNQMMLDERGKPIPQWMITGRLKLEVDAAKADLDRMIDERNKAADEYNLGIDDITRKVEYGTNDAMNEYKYWADEEGRLTNLMANYQKSMTEELGRETESERWGKEFELEERLTKLKEEEAGKPETLKTSISEYVSGGRMIRDTINTQTGEVINREDLGKAGEIIGGKEGGTEDGKEGGTKDEDIESYAQSVFRGEKSLTSVPDSIEPQVRARIQVLNKTERIYTDEQIRAQVRNWVLELGAEYGERSNEEIAEALRGTIELSELPDLDRERFKLILSEIVPIKEKKKGGIVEWLKEPFRNVKEDITGWFK